MIWGVSGLLLETFALNQRMYGKKTEKRMVIFKKTITFALNSCKREGIFFLPGFRAESRWYSGFPVILIGRLAIVFHDVFFLGFYAKTRLIPGK